MLVYLRRDACSDNWGACPGATPGGGGGGGGGGGSGSTLRHATRAAVKEGSKGEDEGKDKPAAAAVGRDAFVGKPVDKWFGGARYRGTVQRRCSAVEEGGGAPMWHVDYEVGR